MLVAVWKPLPVRPEIQAGQEALRNTSVSGVSRASNVCECIWTRVIEGQEDEKEFPESTVASSVGH